MNELDAVARLAKLTAENEVLRAKLQEYRKHVLDWCPCVACRRLKEAAAMAGNIVGKSPLETP